ncbi:CynX/NimT family MFS transporter [Paenibacillus mendelii]|uniref:CynX/NimT family MFS transporter n=1 Tax=Paenibacillus mendelii TaxID=206163 RepID=A0ABV6JJK4_9BACL|nr:MFS transporter [Paenibacillus mendelii]MCQ6558798.1 MFS transporter [Paenibacillus mendelii]
MSAQKNEVLAAGRAQSNSKRVLLVLGLIFIALNLRAPLTAVGPLIGSIRDSVNISNTLAGTITTFPLLAFALLSPFTPLLARRFGTERVVLVALCILAGGIILRSVSGAGTLFGGTILLGLAIAVCNVLLPSLVKREFPHRVGLMTGVYSVSMNMCGAIASGISVPIAVNLGLGWRGALGCWAVLVLLSILVWLPQLRPGTDKHKAAEPVRVQRSSGSSSMWRSGLAWQVTLFMGLQSTIFYIVITWFPQILVDRGMSSDSAGWMVSLMQFALLPITFIIPILAGRMESQRILVMITVVLYLVGIGGFFFGGNGFVPLWSIILGVAIGSSFSLAMMFFSLRTRDAHDAAKLSGMAQSIGYLLAAAGPTLFGMLHDQTGSWNMPFLLLAAASLLILGCGLSAAQNRAV